MYKDELWSLSFCSSKKINKQINITIARKKRNKITYSAKSFLRCRGTRFGKTQNCFFQLKKKTNADNKS